MWIASGPAPLRRRRSQVASRRSTTFGSSEGGCAETLGDRGCPTGCSLSVGLRSMGLLSMRLLGGIADHNLWSSLRSPSWGKKAFALKSHSALRSLSIHSALRSVYSQRLALSTHSTLRLVSTAPCAQYLRKPSKFDSKPKTDSLSNSFEFQLESSKSQQLTTKANRTTQSH